MIHVRVDDEPTNDKAEYRCGLKILPPGDKFYWYSELGARFADCPGCNPEGRRPLGTPISQLSGRNGGNAEFRRISESWGHG